MAKLFLIMICVCTTCVHLACAQMVKKMPLLSESSNQIHRHDVKFRPQGQQQQQRLVIEPSNAQAAAVAAVAPSDSDYGKQIKQTQLGNIKQNFDSNQLHRSKRHAGHSHGGADTVAAANHIEVNPNIGLFIEKLFKQFSNGDSKTLNLIEFEKLMKHLGLDRLIEDKQLNNLIHPSDESSNNHDHSHENHPSDAHSNDTVSCELSWNKKKIGQSSNQSKQFYKMINLNIIMYLSSHLASSTQCISSVWLVSQAVPEHSIVDRQSIQQYETLMNEIRGQSKLSNELNGLTATAIGATDTIDNKSNETSIETIRSIKENIKLGKSDFWSLCPILLYQLAAPNPLERSGCLTTAHFGGEQPHDHEHDHDHDYEHMTETDRKMGKHEWEFLIEWIQSNYDRYFQMYTGEKSQWNGTKKKKKNVRLTWHFKISSETKLQRDKRTNSDRNSNGMEEENVRSPLWSAFVICLALVKGEQSQLKQTHDMHTIAIAISIFFS